MFHTVSSRRIAGWVITAAALCALAGFSDMVAGRWSAGGPAPHLGGPPRAQAAAAGAAPLARGWARVILAGTLASAASPAGVVSVAIGGPSRADVFEGGTAWRTRSLYGTHLVRLLPQMAMMDSTARPIDSETLRGGDRVAVWGVMNPDNDILALSMVVSTARPAPKPAAPSAGAVTGVAGVVAARTGSMLDLVTDTGTRHAVLLTAATQVRGSGPAAAPAIGPFDMVQIDGAVNSDGSVVAARVTLGFQASQGAQVSGPIQAVRADLGGLIVGDTMVSTSAQTYFLRGDSRLWITQIEAGHSVTVYGLPILAGKTPVGLAARVVAVR